MKKLDLRKELKHLYRPSAKKVSVVEVPEMQFATIEGQIEKGRLPGDSPAFVRAVEALYGISYTLKFMSKKRAQDPIDYPVMALEGLWWVEDGHFDIQVPGNWHWQALMMQPEHISGAMFSEALVELLSKKENPALARMRLERFNEGLCIQMMHVGPYAEEIRTIKKLEAFAQAQGYVMHGRHHEIYIGDPTRAKPENLKTVLRNPVRLKSETG